MVALLSGHLFLFSLQNDEEIFSKNNELGTVELLCPLFPIGAGMALVLLT